MEQRPVTADDLAQITALTTRSDTAWFGAPEHDESEVREYLDRLADLALDSRLFHDGDRLLAVATRNDTDRWLVTDPDVAPDVAAEVADAVVEWFAGSAHPAVEVLDRDTAIRDALARHGWTHRSSTFELLRPVSNDWAIGEPVWPDGVTLRAFDRDAAAEMYRLIYVDAAWAEVAGHPHRDFDDWHSLFITGSTDPRLQVLAERDGRLVGIAIGRIFSDGTGWIAQLAVARDERGHGLGRALLLESLRRRCDAGAIVLGLSVKAENRAALDLYLDAGLVIDREWMDYEPAGAVVPG